MAAKPPTVKRVKVASERAAVLSDWHVPHHDPRAVELALAFLAWFRPDTVFVAGDFLDFYSISRFDKDPQRILDLQDDLNAGHALLRRLRRACPDPARIVYLDGNHEHRLIRYLWQHPEIAVLDSLKLTELLKLASLEIEHHSYQEQLEWHGLLIEHGNRVRGKSAYTAAAMMESRGVSGVSGHTHRLGGYYRTDNAGTRVWLENGCLCDLKPVYVIGRPDWQQGFTVAHAMKGKDRFLCEQVPILSHKLYYAGNLWATN